MSFILNLFTFLSATFFGIVIAQTPFANGALILIGAVSIGCLVYLIMAQEW